MRPTVCQPLNCADSSSRFASTTELSRGMSALPGISDINHIPVIARASST